MIEATEEKIIFVPGMVLKGDGYRCRECGEKLAKKNGTLPTNDSKFTWGLISEGHQALPKEGRFLCEDCVKEIHGDKAEIIKDPGAN